MAEEINTLVLSSVLSNIVEECLEIPLNTKKSFNISKLTSWFYMFNLGLLLNLDKKPDGYFIIEEDNDGIVVTLKSY